MDEEDDIYDSEGWEEVFPSDFMLPIEPPQPEDQKDSILDILSSCPSQFPNTSIVLTPEDVILVASIMQLYSAYINYIKEMDPAMHLRAVQFSSDTAELHPNVSLTDLDGNHLRGWTSPDPDGDTPKDGAGDADTEV
jgi:hypothetical protein